MNKKRNSFLQKALLFINFFLVGGILLGYAAMVVDPKSFWYFTLFGLAYPFMLLFNLIFILIWVFQKRWYFLYSLIAILLGYQPLTRTIGFRLPSRNDIVVDSNELKLMTYNVHNFRNQESKLDTALAKSFLNLIKSEDADITGFQEFFSRRRGIYNFEDSVKKAFDTKHYFYSKIDFNDYESVGVAIYSKYPIKDSGEISFQSPDNGNKAIWIDIEKNGKPLRVYSVHLASISFQPEDYLFINEVKSDINQGKDVASSKRIVKRLKTAFIRRSREVELVRNHTENCITPYVIMGDFNDTPASYAVTLMNKGMKNTFQEKGSGLGLTYNGDFPNFQIDYIMASPEFKINTYRVIKKDYSDHYPVRANVSLNPNL